MKVFDIFTKVPELRNMYLHIQCIWLQYVSHCLRAKELVGDTQNSGSDNCPLLPCYNTVGYSQWELLKQ